jgi:ribosomal protein S18 acetylase RimI-like enzyme
VGDARIRDAVVQDCAGIARVQVDSYRGAFAGLMPAEYLQIFTYEEQTQDWQDLIQSSPDLLLVAEGAEGQVVGYALAKQGFVLNLNSDCELVALHVNRDCHRQGIGRALMSETARRMQAAGCRSLGLWVLEGNPACLFYEHLGGKEHGEQFFEIEELHLRKREVGYRWEKIEDLISK